MPKGVYVHSQEQLDRIKQLGKRIRTTVERQKNSDSHKGKYPSVEARKKMSAALIGNTNSHGHHPSDETRRRMSESSKGRVITEVTRQKMRLASIGRPKKKLHKLHIQASKSGINHPNFGKHLSPETKRKLRISLLDRVLKDGGFIAIGKNEKTLLDKQEFLDGVPILRQCHLHYLGYYVDGYCVETNTVYEVYERRHLRPKVASRDAIRQKEIEDYLGCKFVIIWDI